MTTQDFVTIWAVLGSPITAAIAAWWARRIAIEADDRVDQRDGRTQEARQIESEIEVRRQAYAEFIAALHATGATDAAWMQEENAAKRARMRAAAAERVGLAAGKAFVVASPEVLFELAPHATVYAERQKRSDLGNGGQEIGESRARLISAIRSEIESLHSDLRRLRGVKV